MHNHEISRTSKLAKQRGLTKFSTMLKERLVTCAPLRCLWTYLIMFGHSDKSSLYHACPCLFYSDSGLRPYCACHRTTPGKRNDRMCKLCKKIKLVQAPPDQGASRGKVRTQTQNERTSNNKTNPIHAPIHDIFSKNGT